MIGELRLVQKSHTTYFGSNWWNDLPHCHIFYTEPWQRRHSWLGNNHGNRYCLFLGHIRNSWHKKYLLALPFSLRRLPLSTIWVRLWLLRILQFSYILALGRHSFCFVNCAITFIGKKLIFQLYPYSCRDCYMAVVFRVGNTPHYCRRSFCIYHSFASQKKARLCYWKR